MGKTPASELEERFFKFARTLEGCELIDELRLSREQEGAKKADLFFANRSIVCEVKSLQTDTRDKVDRIVAAYRDGPDWPMSYGTWPLAKVLAHLPNGQELNAKITEAASSSVKDLIRSANQQIRSTKQTFRLPGSLGMLVILNDLVGVLSPQVIGWRISQAMRKRKAGGELELAHIHATWVISEAHYVELGPDSLGVPLLVMVDREREGGAQVGAFLDDLLSRWAAFNGAPCFVTSDEQAAREGLMAAQERPTEPPPPLRNQDLWKLAYARRPYLRRLGKEELLDRGRTLVREWVGLFGIGSTGTDDERQRLLIRWTHWMEEIKERGIDMRELKAVLREEDLPKVPAERAPREGQGPPAAAGRKLEVSVVPGRFYTEPRLGFSYCCEEVTDGSVCWVLVESYQHGRLFQARFRQGVEYSGVYVEIVDDEEVARLSEMYRTLAERQATPAGS